MTVPLLNWSSTLRDLGQKNDHFSHSRIIIIYWGFLVITGLCSLFVLTEGATHSKFSSTGYVWPNPVMSCFIQSSSSNYFKLVFSEHNLYKRWYDERTNTNLILPIIDADWAGVNGCSNPCGALPNPAILRTANDYQLLTLKELDNVFGLKDNLSSGERLAGGFEHLMYQWARFLVPFVVVQGICAAAFGRRSPTQIRDALYICIRDWQIPKLDQKFTSPTQVPRHRLLAAKWTALGAYGWTLSVTIICLPVLITTIVAIELQISVLAQSESSIHIGAWSPWAGTGLVLLATLLAKYHRPATEALCRQGLICLLWYQKHNRPHINDDKEKEEKCPICDVLLPQPEKKSHLDFRSRLKEEWSGFCKFWVSPDEAAKYHDRGGRQIEVRPAHAAVLPILSNSHIRNRS